MGTTDPQRLFDDVLARAIPEVRAGGIDVFTFAFYHDHESAAVSICADMEASSARLVRSQNAFNITYFADALAKGDLRTASLFKANIGRSLSLCDFGMVNVARTDLGRIRPDDRFYLSMIRALRRRERTSSRCRATRSACCSAPRRRTTRSATCGRRKPSANSPRRPVR